jgi:acyl-CoA synthetase (AMP-forming)/AMP-acid ligase II
MNLWDSVYSPAAPDAALVFADHTGFHRTTWAGLLKQATRSAAGLRKLGVGPGVPVACVLTNSFDVCAGLLGIWLAGGTAISLPTPGRGVSIENYIEQLQQLCSRAGAPLLLLDDAFAAGVAIVGGTEVVGFGQLPASGRFDPRLPGLDEPAFVQCSSGSTAGPKGCVLTPRAIGAQLAMILDRLEGDPQQDSCYSWLPLSHDMGLFGGFLTALVGGGPLTLGSPLRFLQSPGTWLSDCAESGATTTIGPNFALGLVIRAARRRPPTGRLALRRWILGSDPIQAAVIEDATNIIVPLGASPNALTPAYGLAEATLTVSMKRFGTEPKWTTVELDALYHGTITDASADTTAMTTRVVSCGPPVTDTSLRIVGSSDVGEVVLRSTSLANGYLADPERTARVFTPDGELHTGDFGFIRDGELYVVGRKDDMIPVGGRNIIAGEIESRINSDPRVRSGSCVLVDVDLDGTRELVVLVEPASVDIDFERTAQAMRRTAADVASIGVRECIFLPHGSLPKSPSGKIQRFRCRSLAADSTTLTHARVRVG